MEPAESSSFWDLYWEVRLQELQNQGKKEAILAASKLIRQLWQSTAKPLRLLELGSGEGQIIGALLEAHWRECALPACAGVDYLPASLQKSRHAYPFINFIEGDFTNPHLVDKLGQFEIVLLVNALHEVFSDNLRAAGIPAAKMCVQQALLTAAGRVSVGGYLLLFDGLEPPGDGQQKVRLRFYTLLDFEDFETFSCEYQPFQISYRKVGNAYTVELSMRDFTRYITKMIFLGKHLWQTERLQSYQYYNEEEFRCAFVNSGLKIQELKTLTVDDDKWRRRVEILTPGIEFPTEHILIIAQKFG